MKIISSTEKNYTKKDKVIIEGYAFLEDKDSSKAKTSIYLLGINSKKEIKAKMDDINRPDVNSYFSSKNNYNHVGYRAIFSKEDLEDDECYEMIITIKYNDNETKLYNTETSNRFLLNGQVYDYNPNDKPDIDIQSELLDNVFLHGQLCINKKELGMYIYHYENKLYWIATKDFKFSDDGETSIPCLVHTSQTEKLPDYRIKYGFDNLGFIFENNEYLDEEVGNYRVAIRELPGDYPITYIMTGSYDKENQKWFWNGQFCLDNLFDSSY